VKPFYVHGVSAIRTEASSFTLMRTAITLIGWALVAALAWRLADEVAHAVTVFGTARAPQSDAYDPWLRGALTYLFFGEPHQSLYRPTIGLFFGTIIAVAQRIDAVPAFFAALLCATLAVAIAKADEDLKPALVAWLAFAVLEFDLVLKPLNFGNQMPDAPAFAFTLVGMCAVLASMRSRPFDGRWIAIGFFALGIAATIRGPMMLAAPAVLLFLLAIEPKRRTLRMLLVGAALFALPLCIDVVQQRLHGVVNNGVVTMYCFYTDPSFSWTTRCHNQYLAVEPRAAEVIEQYLRTVASSGYDIVLGNLNARLYQEGLHLHTNGFRLASKALAGYLLLSAAWSAVPGMRARTAWAWLAYPIHARYFLVVRLAVLAAVARYAWLLPYESFPAVLSIAIAALCVVFRLARPFMCLAAYWLGVVFLSLMTQAHQNRLGFTISFLLYLAVFLSVADHRTRRASDNATPSRPSRPLTAIYFVMVAFLYVGVFLVPGEWKRMYRQQVDGTQEALVISEDRALKQCLYFSGRREMYYGQCAK
jgi:hypothetical protein